MIRKADVGAFSTAVACAYTLTASDAVSVYQEYASLSSTLRACCRQVSAWRLRSYRFCRLACIRSRSKDGSGFDLSGEGVQRLHHFLNGSAVFHNAVCGEGQGGFGELKIPFAHLVMGGRLDPLEGA